MRQVLFTIPIFGGIKLFGYGTLMVLAFIGSTWAATWRARREKLDPDVILDMAFWIFFLGMVGARLFYCIQYWGRGIDSLLDVVQYWKGGIVYYGGILGGVILGLGRALGETMAVTMVIGNRPEISKSLIAPGYTLASVIANEFSEAVDNMHLSSLVEIALVLFILTLVVNALARLLVWSVTRGAAARTLA